MELPITGEIIRVQLADPFKTEGLDYWKHVTGLDRSKIRRGGYAYEGNFVSREVDLPAGALLIRGSSVKRRSYAEKFMQLYRVTPEGLCPIPGPSPTKDGSTSISSHCLTFFEFVEEQFGRVQSNAAVLDLANFTDHELLYELSRRGYFTIAEARELREVRKEGYKPELPQPEIRCRKIKVDGERCSRKARTGLTTCWQHR